jgi:hypothetical protein
MPRVPFRSHRERRRLLTVKRAQPFEDGAGSFECDGLADQIGDRELRLDLGNDA